MHQQFKAFIDDIILGEPLCHQYMAVVPLFINDEPEPAYLTLGQALEDGLITVTEISEAGSVPDLKVENRAELPVLLLDGEELAGARQNRVVNTTILLEPNSTTVIPVSCTEQGRWAYRTPEFVDSQTVMSPSVRHHKVRSVSRSLRMKMGARSDQGKVWQEIDALSMRADAKSPTSAMRDVHMHLAKKIDAFCEAFKLQDGQNGLMAIVGERAVGFDILSRHEPFGRLFPKLVRSYAADAVLEKDAKAAGQPAELAREFLQTACLASESRHEAVGLGEDCRFVGDTVVGSALLVDPAVVHMAFFRSDATESREPLLRSRRRRDFRR
jgi:hypothetical protein